jgi:hypothetical protein
MVGRRKTYYAVYRNEIVPCHLIAKKDRDWRGAFAANSKRDKRRFLTVYDTIEEATRKAAEYETKIKNETR